MIHLMLHDDWEINGDGTGNPTYLMFEPVKKILDICDEYSAKYTFYAEVGQQFHMLNAPRKKWKQYANTWENLLKDAIARGHDVQLHFHPQWIGAKLKKGKWELDYSKWGAGLVENELLDEWIGNGKYYLEALLNPVNPDYQVLSFRAGGWLCQPSTGLYKAFKKHGIVCDVSVMKGRYAEYEDGSKLDFRDAVSRCRPWEVDPDDFAREMKGSGVWEVPVFTEETKLPHPVYLLKKAFHPLYYYQINRKQNGRKGCGDYSLRIINGGESKEHYGSFGYMHHKHLKSYIVEVIRNAKIKSDINHLILLTHSKSFLDFENFDKLLSKISQNPSVCFSTTRGYVKEHII